MRRWSSFASRNVPRTRHPVRREFRSRLAAGFATALGVILLLSDLAGCGQIQVTIVSGAPEGPTIAIGITAGESSVGARRDDMCQGFGITITKYVITELGYTDRQVISKQARLKNQRFTLDSRQVDMVIASWPITDESNAIVDFVGPYLTTNVGLLVRSGECGRFISGAGLVGDVDDGAMCAVKGGKTVGTSRGNHPQARIQGRSSCTQYVTAVRIRSTDAIASDVVALFGFQAASGPQYMDVVTDKDEIGYGITVSQGTSQLVQKIAEVSEDMVKDGSQATTKDTFISQAKPVVSLNGDPKTIVSGVK